MNLELMGMVWLRCEKHCVIVTRERQLRWGAGQPDVMGITAARFFLEIEIKRSAQDFYKDKAKRHRINREFYLDQQPKEFYYLMPREIYDVVHKSIPEFSGAMTPTESGLFIEVRKPSPINRKSAKVSLKECAKAVGHQTNFILSLERKVERLQCNLNEFRQSQVTDAVLALQRPNELVKRTT